MIMHDDDIGCTFGIQHVLGLNKFQMLYCSTLEKALNWFFYSRLWKGIIFIEILCIDTEINVFCAMTSYFLVYPTYVFKSNTMPIVFLT